MKKTTDRTKPKGTRSAASRLPKVKIRKLPTGVRGLDDILGGGIPEFSFNVIGAAPGCGKTTMAHQIAFANATPEKPALYFTVLGEPTLKMRRYQQQFSFFDETKMGKAVRFINLSTVVLAQDLTAVFAAITDKGFVVIGPRETDYSGLTTGIPRRSGATPEDPPEPKAVR